MNPLMIQQAMATARTLPSKAVPPQEDGGEFAAIAASLLGVEPADKGKNASADATNPLAALLLAALIAQPQPFQPVAEEPQMAAGSAPDTLTAMSAQPHNERLITLLQGLGMNAGEAEAFAARLADAVQTRATGADHADQALNAALAGQEGADDAVAQVRMLLDNLLANEASPTPEQPATLPQARLDIGTAIKLRAALSSFGATQPAPQAAMPPEAQTVAPQVALPAQAHNAAMHSETQSAEQAASARPAVSSAAVASTASAETANPLISAAAVSSGEEEQSAATGQNSSDSAGQGAPTQDAAASVLPFAAPHRAQQTVREPQAHSVTRTLGEAFDTMVDTLSTLRRGPRSEMEIHLKPDFLGKVVIKLTLEEGSLVARISASNAGVQEAFQAQAPSLTTALQQQGVKDVTVLVAHDTAAGGMLDHSTSSRHNQNPREQRRRAATSLDAADKADTVRAAQAYEQFWRSGTINYLA